MNKVGVLCLAQGKSPTRRWHCMEVEAGISLASRLNAKKGIRKSIGVHLNARTSSNLYHVIISVDENRPKPTPISFAL